MLTRSERIHKTVKRVKLQLRHKAAPAYPGFVLGCQRSGTNMMMGILDASPETECYNESDEEAFDNYLLRDLNLVATLTAKSAAKITFFKCILSSQHARTLLDRNPTGKILWMFRRYEDVVNSNLKQFSNHTDEIKWMLFEPEKAGWRADNVAPEDMAMTRHFWEKGISDASARALMWVLRNRLLFRQGLETDPRVIAVDYDHLVTNPEPTVATVFKFLDLRFEPQFVKSVHSGSVRKDPAPEIDPELIEIAEEVWKHLSAIARI